MKSEDEASIELSQELNSLTKTINPPQYGPTQLLAKSFIEKTEQYGLKGFHAVSMNVVDLDFDGKSDLVLLPFYYSRPKFLIFSKKEKKFKPWDHDPLPEDFKASYLIIQDINKDEIPDLISAVFNQKSEVTQIPVKFFRGEVKKGKLHFKYISEAIKNQPEPTSSLSLVDFDLDGWLDLFIGNWFEHKNQQFIPVADRLMRNTTKGKFEDVSILLRGETDKNNDQLFPPQARPTYGSSTCDIDQNGFPDILTVSSAGQKNKLWMNHKDTAKVGRYFEDVGLVSNYACDPQGSLIPTGGGRSFFSACTDYNDDGLMDIFLGELTHGYDNDSVDRSSVLTGAKQSYPPYFIRTEYVSDGSSETWNQGDRRAIWLDYNLDGKIDLLVENSGFPPYSRLVMFEQDEHHAFINVAPQLGIDIVNPSATVVLDINDDGKPDIMTSQNNIRKSDIPSKIYLFENHLEIPESRVIRFHLNGVNANTDGIGAMVIASLVSKQKPEVKLTQRRWIEYFQGGLASQNEKGLILAIPEKFEISNIKVRWPFMKRTGRGAGDILEQNYQVKSFLNKSLSELTLCENGKILKGKSSCQF